MSSWAINERYSQELDTPIKRLNHSSHGNSECCCMGAKNGDPVCPCRMWIWDVQKEDGKWTMATLYGDGRKDIE